MQVQRPRQRLESIRLSEKSSAAERPARRSLQSYFAKRPSGPLRRIKRVMKDISA